MIQVTQRIAISTLQWALQQTDDEELKRVIQEELQKWYDTGDEEVMSDV